MSDLGTKLVSLAQNGTNLGLFQIRFHYILARRAKMWNLIWNSTGFFSFGVNLTHFLPKSDILSFTFTSFQIGSDCLGEPKCTETDFSPRFVPFVANVTQFGCQIWHPSHLQLKWFVRSLNIWLCNSRYWVCVICCVELK